MLYSTIIKLLVSGYLLFNNLVTCKIYGTYSTFDPLGPFTANQTHKHTSTGLITHYSVNGHHHHAQEQAANHDHQQQESAQKRQDYHHPPPVEAQPFTPPQHDDAQYSTAQNGQQIHMYHEDPAIAKPFENNLPKNPTTPPTLPPQSYQQQQPLMSTAAATGGNRMPLYLYNPSLARRLGISTFLTGTVLYGLSLLPALLAVGVGSGVGPFAGLMSSLTGSKRKKRKRRHIPSDHWEQRINNTLIPIIETQTMATGDLKFDRTHFGDNGNNIPKNMNDHFFGKTSPSPLDLENLPSDLSLYVTKRSPGPYIPSTMHYKYREMPMMDHRGSYRFLGLLENTLEIRKIDDPSCKKNLLCNVYKNAIGISDHPTAADFEIALIDTFGITAERNNHKVDVISMVKYYLDAALVGMTRGGSCTKVFPCIHSTAFYRFFPVAAAFSGSTSGQQLGSGHPSSAGQPLDHSETESNTVLPTSPAPIAFPFRERTKPIKLNIN